MANVSQTPLPSLVLRLDPSGIVSAPKPLQHAYRTEIYLQQREQLRSSSSSSNVTTWKDLMQQKQIIQHDQAEIDRALSTMDSIHGSLNRSLIVPYDRVYAHLYGTGGVEDESTRLMTSFCQRQDHLPFGDDNPSTMCDDSLNSMGLTQLTDSDESEDDFEEKKKSYDSGYGSIVPRQKFFL